MTSEIGDIALSLNPIIKKLGYPLSFDEIELSNYDIETTLTEIDAHFQKSGYTLVTLRGYCDSYFLFIISYENYAKLLDLSQQVEFEFYNFNN